MQATVFQPGILSFPQDSEHSSLYKDVILTSAFQRNIKIVDSTEENLPEITTKKLLKEIENANKFLELGKNWDGEGSPAFKVTTLERAQRFLLSIYNYACEQYHHTFKIPEIMLGPGSSLDIMWESTEFTLLINIPENTEAPLSFYGNHKTQGEFEGCLKSIDNPSSIVSWLNNIF